jgi:hypothetical protein
MTEDLLDYWLRILRPLFPTNAWIASRLSEGGHLIQIDWRLDNDSCQPSKRSRKIQIIIPEEAIDDYLNKNKADRELSDIKMKMWISDHYNHFNPDHDANTSRYISGEKWRISRDVLSP